MSALDVNPRYFERIHPYSNVFAFERYVRLTRSKSSKVVGPNSPMQRIFEHVAGDAKFRELREDDRDLEGYHHRVKIDSAGAATLVDGHSLGKKIKHYHPKHVRDDSDDPLFHPKLGVSLQQNVNADGAVSWSDREALVHELDETLLNVLSWAGLPVRADSSVYVEDAYFSVRETARDLSLVPDPTPEIRREQDAIVTKALTANADLNESDVGTLEVVADGGRTPEEIIASEIGFKKRTVRRVVDRLSDVLSIENGDVGFASDYLASAVQRALGDVADALDKDGDSSGEGSAFDAWRHRYGVECEDPPDARLQLRIGRVDEDLKAILREGYLAWIQSGRKGRRFDTAKFSYRKGGFRQFQMGR
jgi:hypothetical protein